MSARTTKMKGQAKEVKGNAKAAAGRATGNDRMKASGRADVSEGKAQSALGGAGLKVKKITKNIVGKR
ncbi:MAG: CsbD family protein [Dehalococcoidia bacterium]